MRLRFSPLRSAGLLVCATLLLPVIQLPAANPPAGFQALFNGRDLSGWWGLSTEDPAKWQALNADELARKKSSSLEDVRKHWRADGEELVNDGEGLYLSTDKDYGVFELLLHYKRA